MGVRCGVGFEAGLWRRGSTIPRWPIGVQTEACLVLGYCTPSGLVLQMMVMMVAVTRHVLLHHDHLGHCRWMVVADLTFHACVGMCVLSQF